VGSPFAETESPVGLLTVVETGTVFVTGRAALHADQGPRFWVMETAVPDDMGSPQKKPAYMLSVYTLLDTGFEIGSVPADQQEELNEWVRRANAFIEQRIKLMPAFARIRRLLTHLRQKTIAPGGATLTADTVFRMFDVLLQDLADKPD
jgi:hypothetical protein